MPDRAMAWDDLVRGEVSFAPEHVPDFVIVRGNGEPLYTLVNPVDDALMGITHVLRGEDLLSSTPRQLAMYEALAAIGVGDGSTPRFGHLPYVMGEGNKKLSKRDPQSSLNLYREQGYLPEGLLNYLALLGWSPGDDLEFFSPTQMARAVRHHPGAAQPRAVRLQEVPGHQRRLDPARDRGRPRSAARALPRRRRRDRRHARPPSSSRSSTPRCRWCRSGWRRCSRGPSRCGSCSSPRRRSSVDAEDRERVLTEEARPTVQAAYDALADLEPFDHAAIEAALRAALVDGLGLKPKLAFGPVRVAVTGRRISPPLFESMELLGRERTLGRLAAVLDWPCAALRRV